MNTTKRYFIKAKCAIGLHTNSFFNYVLSETAVMKRVVWLKETKCVFCNKSSITVELQ